MDNYAVDIVINGNRKFHYLTQSNGTVLMAFNVILILELYPI